MIKKKKKKSHLRCRCSLILWKQQSSEPLNRWQQHPWTTGRTKATNNRRPPPAGFIWLQSGGLLMWGGWTSCTGWRTFLSDDSTDLRVRTCPSLRRYWPVAIWTYKDGRSTVPGNNALALSAQPISWRDMEHLNSPTAEGREIINPSKVKLSNFHSLHSKDFSPNHFNPDTFHNGCGIISSSWVRRLF